MLKYKNTIIFLLIIILIILYQFFKPTFLMNGNNKQNIIKVICSLEGYENKDSIKILKIIDSKNDRLVPFLYNNSPSYLLFSKNKIGNYKWQYAEKRSNESLSIFSIRLSLDEVLIVTNGENQIAKMKMKANGKKLIETELSVGENSASFFKLDKLPKEIDHGYEINYEFFDKEGKQIIEKD
ncbi:hypothetical protein [Bacillus sp. EAC]|uniref:hypothetical protein n=1 Tax=Bacillus sp. EAC TaxID=1978338 RepID=UPI000B434A0C|nr:hypothetical protein [Bacillus sp. EAC]